MALDKSHQYVYRIGSDNQYRLHWDGGSWRYELLAGSVLFDEQKFSTEEELLEAMAMHGLTMELFHEDTAKAGELYSAEIEKKRKELEAAGIRPCPKHGLTSKNPDGTCEACQNSDYFDDFKGTEG
jgi:hypothetical protein